MSRQQFTARNNIGSVLTFQKSGATASFDPITVFEGSPLKRVSWKLDNGTNESDAKYFAIGPLTIQRNELNSNLNGRNIGRFKSKLLAL